MESHLNLGELRIGNHFKWSELASMGKDYDKVDLDNIKYHQFFEPIKLSEEILLKAGFEKCLNGFWSETEIFNVKIIDNEILVYLAGSDTNLAHNNLKNLHQLQNLIHALTGEELTINL